MFFPIVGGKKIKIKIGLFPAVGRKKVCVTYMSEEKKRTEGKGRKKRKEGLRKC